MDYKLSVLAVLLGVATIAFSADEKSSTPAPGTDDATIRIFRRLIPADVLRGSSKHFKSIYIINTKR